MLPSSSHLDGSGSSKYLPSSSYSSFYTDSSPTLPSSPAPPLDRAATIRASLERKAYHSSHLSRFAQRSLQHSISTPDLRQQPATPRQDYGPANPESSTSPPGGDLSASSSSSAFSSASSSPFVLGETSFAPSFSMPAVSRRNPHHKFRTVHVHRDITFKNEQKGQFLLCPPWLALANATRVLPKLMKESVESSSSSVPLAPLSQPSPGPLLLLRLPSSPNASPLRLPASGPTYGRSAMPANGERNQAALLVQRSFRGWSLRARLWRVGGLGTHWMARKIQARFRGMLGRRRAAMLWHERDTREADKIIGLYWGMQGRRIARMKRVENWGNAASLIQRNYRGRLGKKMFAIHRERMRNRKATFLQRCYRGYRGRLFYFIYCKRLKDGELKMKRIADLHENGKLWDSIYDKDGDGKDDDQPPLEHELLDAALALLCVAGDYENARLYTRDALRFYPESPRALYTYAILLHIVWSSFGFLKVPRPDILDEALEIAAKAWTLDVKRDAYTEFEVSYFQNARRLKASDPRRLAVQAVMLHVVYGSFETASLTKKRLLTYWDSNRRAENLLRRAIEMDEHCAYPSIRSMAGAFRTLYKVKRELITTKPKSFPIGHGGAKVVFNVSIYKCIDPASTEFDRREKMLCVASEKPAAKEKGKEGAGAGEGERGGDTTTPKVAEGSGGISLVKRKLSMMKDAAKGLILTNALKVDQLESKFKVKESRKKAKAEATVTGHHTDMQKYRAHLRILNLKTNPVSREFVIHEEEWMSLLEAAVAQEKKAGRPVKMVDEDAVKNPMKLVSNYILSKLCIRSVFDTIENERQRVLVLPQIQGVRDKAVMSMIADNAVRRIQRVFRGFSGRAQIRRMLFRKRAQEEFAKRLVKLRQKMSERRQRRALCCCLVQARIKGMLWRKRLQKMVGAAIIIQQYYRGFACRQAIKEKQRKLFEGAKVDVVYKRGRVVSGVNLFLTVVRCGLSFKFIGRSEEHMDTFYGYVYRESTLEIVKDFNVKQTEEIARLKAREEAMEKDMYKGYDSSRESVSSKSMREMQALMKGRLKVPDPKRMEIKHFQTERILGVLLDNLALVEPIQASSYEMQKLEGKMVFICDYKLGPKAAGTGVLKFNGQKRILKDQKKAIARYERDLQKRQAYQASKGLPVSLY